MPIHETLETKELVIRDGNGRCRIRLGLKEDVPCIQMFDTTDTPRINIHLGDKTSGGAERPEIELLDRNGDFMAAFGIEVATEVQSNPQNFMQEGPLQIESPYLYLKRGAEDQLIGIDLLFFNDDPMVLITRPGRVKHSLTVDVASTVQVKKNPFG